MASGIAAVWTAIGSLGSGLGTTGVSGAIGSAIGTAAQGAVIGAVVNGAVSAFTGGDILEDAAKGALLGGVTGGLLSGAESALGSMGEASSLTSLGDIGEGVGAVAETTVDVGTNAAQRAIDAAGGINVATGEGLMTPAMNISQTVSETAKSTVPTLSSDVLATADLGKMGTTTQRTADQSLTKQDLADAVSKAGEKTTRGQIIEGAMQGGTAYLEAADQAKERERLEDIRRQEIENMNYIPGVETRPGLLSASPPQWQQFNEQAGGASRTAAPTAQFLWDKPQVGGVRP